MRGRPATHRYAMTHHDKVISKHYTLWELYDAHKDLFKNETQLRNWSAGRCISSIPKSYRLLKL